jgi:hypothetical protein
MAAKFDEATSEKAGGGTSGILCSPHVGVSLWRPNH